MNRSVLLSFAVAAAIAALPAQASEVSLQPYANADVSRYSSGGDYPSGSTTIGGIPFLLASFGDNPDTGGAGTGIVQLSGNGSVNIAIDQTGVNTAYVILNSAFGSFGSLNGTLAFLGGASGASTDSIGLVQGFNIRDHLDGNFQNISTTTFATADYPGGNRFDVYRYDLSALGGVVDTLVFSSAGQADGNGIPFLAGLTLTSEAAAVPESATWAMMIGGFGLMGGAMRRRRTTPAFG